MLDPKVNPGVSAMVRMRRILLSAFAALIVGAGAWGSAQAACLSAELESNNTDTAANTGACSGVPISGSLSSSSDFDWFRLDVTGPGTISISLAHATGVDFDWFLYAATGSYIARGSSTANPEVGSKAVTAAGTYYVRIKSYTGQGAYTLVVNGPLAGGSGGGGNGAPVFGPFSLPAKVVGDAPFVITPPTSNSTGPFTYTSSDTTVASISGSTVTLVGAGSSTITARQAADATHTAGSTSATLTVAPSSAWPCTLPAGVDLGRVGSSTDRVATTTGGFVLMGGGTDVDAAMQWMIGKSGGGDVVVLRSTGTNGYNAYLYGLGGVNSVQTLLIASATDGDNACVAETLKRAEMVFIAGGNQQNYIDYFKGRATGDALNDLITSKKVPIGGTSAGMAILGQYYHPGGAPADSTVLINPTAVAIGNNFLNAPLLANVVTEPHFSQRSRQPRLTAFLASTIYNYGVGWQSVRGIACDEATAYALDTTGAGKVFGTNACFFAKPTGAPEVLAPGSVLTWNLANKALNVLRVPGTASGSNTFNINSFTGTGGTVQTWWVDRGTLTIR
jgi:cyanophycinase